MHEAVPARINEANLAKISTTLIENNIDFCLFDGGDCCLEVNMTHCKECNCIIAKDEFDPYPEGEKVGDGSCDLRNNNTVCSFDGGDCSR